MCTEHSYILQLLLLAATTRSWDADYVAQKLVLSTAVVTQELLFCVCHECYDERLDKLLRLTQQATMHPQLVLSNRTDFQLRNGNHKRNLFTVVLAKTLDDHVFEVFDEVTRGRHFYLCMVLMFEPLQDFGLAELWLRHLQHGQFVNTNLYYRNGSTQDNEIFGFTSYPVFKVQNKSLLINNWRDLFNFVRSPLNLHGYRFYTPLMQHAPRVIRLGPGAGERVKGSSYRALKIFTEHINSTLVEFKEQQQENGTQWQPINMRHVLDLVRTKRVEIAAHAYALFVADASIDKSYPIAVVNWCLMVPIAAKVSTMYFLLLPFEPTTWCCLLLTLGVWLLFHYMWLRQPCKRNFVLQSMCLFINLSPPAAEQHKDSLPHVLLNCSVYFHGFFLTAFYTSLLGSFLTVTISRSTINTLADLIAAQLPVMIIDYELEFLLRTWSPTQEFRNLLYVVDSDIFHQHQFALNESYAYFVTADQWHFLDMQQRYLKRRLFLFSDICFGAYHQAFPMQPDLPIWRELEYFLYSLHSSGLFFIYEAKAYLYAMEAGVLHRFMEDDHLESIGMAQLKVVFLVYLLMLLVSGLCFVLELYAERWKRRLGRQTRHIQKRFKSFYRKIKS